MTRANNRYKRGTAAKKPTTTNDGNKPAKLDTKEAEKLPASSQLGTTNNPVAENHHADPPKKQTPREALLGYLKQHGFAIFTLLFTGGAALFTWQQANIAGKALVIGQRAFVQFDGAEETIADNWDTHSESNGNLTVWNVPKNLGKMIHSKFRFTNAGNTPTKNLQIMLHCELVGPPRRIGDPFILLKWDHNKIIKRSIGAHQSIDVSDETCDFKNSDILLNAQMHVVPVFLTGYLKYEDWIEPGKTHRTQFAHQLIVHDVGKMPGFDDMGVETEPIGQHNCTDEDCPND